jgi:flagellin
MKLSGTINRLSGVEKNIDNAISFLQVQDGVLDSTGQILDRMAELKALSQDVLKNSSDIANYNAEFQNLQVQLFQMSRTEFNGVSLFATTDATIGGTGTTFNTVGSGNTISIFTSATGESGSRVSINKASMLAALTITSTTGQVHTANTFQSAAGDTAIYSFGSESTSGAFELGDVSVAVFSQALQNIATLRAENGGSVSRLQFAKESASAQKTNLEAANGRIMDVDIASESTALAKYNILVQASASMLSQANSTPNVALMLLN